jgi:hypothetical protein
MTAAMNLVMKAQNQQTPNWFDVRSTAIKKPLPSCIKDVTQTFIACLHMSGRPERLMMSLRNPMAPLTKAGLRRDQRCSELSRLGIARNQVLGDDRVRPADRTG